MGTVTRSVASTVQRFPACMAARLPKSVSPRARTGGRRFTDYAWPHKDLGQLSVRLDTGTARVRVQSDRVRATRNALLDAYTCFPRNEAVLLTRIKAQQVQAMLPDAFVSCRCQPLHQPASVRYEGHSTHFMSRDCPT